MSDEKDTRSLSQVLAEYGANEEDFKELLKLFPKVKVINRRKDELEKLLPNKKERELRKLFASYYKKRVRRANNDNSVKWTLFRKPFPMIYLYEQGDELQEDFRPIIYTKWREVIYEYRRLILLHSKACSGFVPSAGTFIQRIADINK